MLAIIKFLVFGHLHHWATIAEGPFERREDGAVVHRGTKYTCRCERCGTIKAFTP